ncbi:MAG: hypothetical protein Q8K65_11830 [Alphaproteobacteria bacterium]|nr:hypothetical protein [Alphaproteobacteria bacterium]
MEIAMLIGGSMMTGGTAAAAGTAAAGAAAAAIPAAASGIMWAPLGMSVAQAAGAGIPLVAGTAAAGGGSLLSMLSTGFSMASMASDLFGGIMGGAQQSQALEMQAREGLLAAKNDELRGKQEANDIMENMIQTIAQQRLAFSGAGIDSGFGSAAALADNTRRLAERQLDTSRLNTSIGVLQRRRQAAASLSQRSGAMFQSVAAGVGSAGKTMTNLIAARDRRG